MPRKVLACQLRSTWKQGLLITVLNSTGELTPTIVSRLLFPGRVSGNCEQLSRDAVIFPERAVPPPPRPRRGFTAFIDDRDWVTAGKRLPPRSTLKQFIAGKKRETVRLVALSSVPRLASRFFKNSIGESDNSVSFTSRIALSARSRLVD